MDEFDDLAYESTAKARKMGYGGRLEWKPYKRKSGIRVYYFVHRFDTYLNGLRTRHSKYIGGKSRKCEYTAKEWKDLCDKYDNRCIVCGSDEPLTPDHIVPQSLNGSDKIDNIQPMYFDCNAEKRQKIIDYR